MSTRKGHGALLSGSYPSAADAELQSLMRTYNVHGRAAAQLAAEEALQLHRIGTYDYVWLVRWTEGRA